MIPSVIVVQSESWLDAEKTTALKFRTGLHLFNGADGYTTAHDRIIVWRHLATCPNRETLTTRPLYQQDGAESWSCHGCRAEPIVYDRKRPGFLARLAVRLLGGRAYAQDAIRA